MYNFFDCNNLRNSLQTVTSLKQHNLACLLKFTSDNNLTSKIKLSLKHYDSDTCYQNNVAENIFKVSLETAVTN